MNNRKSKYSILAGIFLVVNRKKSSDNDKKEIITTEEKLFNEENNLNKEFVNNENNLNKAPETNQYKISDINYTTCLVLCIFLGWLQVHRFYAGLYKSAIIRLTASLSPIIAASLLTLSLFSNDMGWGMGEVGAMLLLVFWGGAVMVSAIITLPFYGVDIYLLIRNRFKDGKGKFIVDNRKNIVIKDEVSDKSWSVCLILCIFLGEFQVHRFYAGLYKQAIIILIVGLIFAIMPFLLVADLILIISGEFADSEGKYIRR